MVVRTVSLFDNKYVCITKWTFTATQQFPLSFQTYADDVFFSQEWKDHRLILPDNMTREYQLLPVEWLNLIWRPDSFFKNAKKVTFQTMTIPNHYVWLYKDKTILYMVK